MKTIIMIFVLALLAGCAVVPLDPYYRGHRYYDRGGGYYGDYHRGYPVYGPRYYDYDGRRGRGHDDRGGRGPR